jgi:hypothetical protein
MVRRYIAWRNRNAHDRARAGLETWKRLAALPTADEALARPYHPASRERSGPKVTHREPMSALSLASQNWYGRRWVKQRPLPTSDLGQVHGFGDSRSQRHYDDQGGR